MTKYAVTLCMYGSWLGERTVEIEAADETEAGELALEEVGIASFLEDVGFEIEDATTYLNEDKPDNGITTKRLT